MIDRALRLPQQVACMADLSITFEIGLSAQKYQLTTGKPHAVGNFDL